MLENGFRVGDIFLEWRDEDTVLVQNTKLGRGAVIHGGDLEGMLNALVESTFLVERELIAKLEKADSL